MKQVKLFFSLLLPLVCLVSTNSCSQTTFSGSANPAVFEATTPCNAAVKNIFQIPQDFKAEMMKWKLILYSNAKSSAPSTYELICTYGIPKQRTKDLMEGAGKIELKGKWKITKGTGGDAEAVVYELNADNSPVSLSFLKPGENLLHLLDADKRMMVGSAAWSYTLNRINPVATSSVKLNAKAGLSTPRITTDSIIVGIFEGRTPCDENLCKLNRISTEGCQGIKCQLILYQDIKTHEPTSFLLHTVYVGKGDTKYGNTGKWTITRGTKTDATAIVYQLEADDPKVSLALMRADDNILFFLDENKDLLTTGSRYTAYTLNRKRRQ